MMNKKIINGEKRFVDTPSRFISEIILIPVFPFLNTFQPVQQILIVLWIYVFFVLVLPVLTRQRSSSLGQKVRGQIKKYEFDGLVLAIPYTIINDQQTTINLTFFLFRETSSLYFCKD